MKEKGSTTKKKSSHTKKKIKQTLLLLFFALFVLIGSAYFYYILVYRVNHEPEPTSTVTTSEPLYELKNHRFFLALMPEVKAAAFNGRAAEIDYGTYVVPGLLSTETQVFEEKNTSAICTSMTPQGLAVTEDYLIVSAYCGSKTHNSVLYLIDKKSHEFIKEIVLRNKSHVGGLAYDPIHQNLWIAGMSRGIPQVNAISLAQLKEYSFQDKHEPIIYAQSYDLYSISRCSFLTYYDNSLYVGYYTKNTASVMEEYLITEDGTLATQIPADSLKRSDSITPIALPYDMRVITEQAQGVAFYKGKLIFSHSYGIFPSKLQIFNNSLQKLLEEDAVIKKMYFPEKLEQIYVDGDDLYVLFESAAYNYRASSALKIDRILKLNLETLLN